MDESAFWEMIEVAWQSVGGKLAECQRLRDGRLLQGMTEELLESLGEFIKVLRDALDKLSAADLLSFDRILERKLYDIDRLEIQMHTDCSDDGFLYARGFIVAAGKGYYEAVNANPSIAMRDLECEELCYLSWHFYEEKFGEVPHSGISRESCSNKTGWHDLR